MMKIYQNQKAKCSIQFQIRIVEFWTVEFWSRLFVCAFLVQTEVKLWTKSPLLIHFQHVQLFQTLFLTKNSTENKTYDFQGYLTLYLAPRYCQTRYSYLLSHPKLQAERKYLSFRYSFLRIFMVSVIKSVL